MRTTVMAATAASPAPRPGGQGGPRPRQRRDHSRRFDTRHSTRQLAREAKRIRRYLEKKMARLPDGAFTFELHCTGTASTGGGLTRLTSSFSSGEAPQPPPPARAGGGMTRADVLVMPGTAEARARKTREILRALWTLGHARGTAWEGRRQIYAAVREGAPPFDWWEAVAHVPFDNKALDIPEVSQRVFVHAAPLVHALLPVSDDGPS